VSTVSTLAFDDAMRCEAGYSIFGVVRECEEKVQTWSGKRDSSGVCEETASSVSDMRGQVLYCTVQYYGPLRRPQAGPRSRPLVWGAAARSRTK
jgi:hypothetical protein